MAVTTAPNNSDSLVSNIFCEHCTLEMPLLSSDQLDQSSLWVCASCGADHLAYADADLLPEFSSLVRIHKKQFETDDSPGIPAHIRVHLASIANRANPQEVNRRRSVRVVNPLMLSAIEMNKEFHLLGGALNVIMTDISREGVGLALTDGTKAPYLALKFPPRGEQEIQVVARVVRQQPLIPPYVAVGCEFMFRLGS